MREERVEIPDEDAATRSEINALVAGWLVELNDNCIDYDGETVERYFEDAREMVNSRKQSREGEVVE